MKQIEVIARVTVLIVSCGMPVSAQVTDLLAKCTEIKDVKKRLACFDTMAPIITKQIDEVNTAQRNREKEAHAQKKTEVDTVQLEQQKLVRETVRELRKLTTATEVGISKIVTPYKLRGWLKIWVFRHWPCMAVRAHAYTWVMPNMTLLLP